MGEWLPARPVKKRGDLGKIPQIQRDKTYYLAFFFFIPYLKFFD